MFSISQHSTDFEEYYDHIQDGLKTLAGMDELMAGKYITILCSVYETFNAVLYHVMANFGCLQILRFPRTLTIKSLLLYKLPTNPCETL